MLYHTARPRNGQKGNFTMTYANFSDTVLDLQLFGDGTAAAPGDGGESSGNIGAGDKSRGLDAAAAKSKGAKNNPLADVIYGKDTNVPPDAEATDAAEIQQTKNLTEQKKETPDKNAAFEEMINGEYKEAFNERVKSIVEKRLKSLKQTDSKYESLRPVLDMLAEKYGVDPADTASLSKAIEEDNSLYEKEALEKGIPVENLKSIRKLEHENNVLKQQIKDRESRESAERIYASWLDQANTAKSIYPGLSLETEIQH